MNWRPFLTSQAMPLALGQAARVGLSFLSTTVVVAVASPEDAGRFFVGLAAVSLAGPLVGLGGSDAAMRLTSRGAGMGTVVRVLAPRSLPLAGLAAVVSAVVLPVLTRAADWWWVFAALVASLALATALRSWTHAFLLDADRVVEAGAHEALRGVGRLGAVAAAAVSGQGPWLVVAYGVGSLVVALAALVATVVRDRGVVDGAGIPAVDVRHSMRVALGNTLRAGYESADQLLLPLFVPLAVVRDYGLAAAVVYSLFIGIGAVGEPQVPEMYRTADSSGVATRGDRRMLATGVTMYVGSAVIGGVLAWWFAAPRVLVLALVLGVILPLRSSSYLSLAALTSDGAQARRNRIEYVGGLGNVVVNLVLMPLVGAIGAAMATVGAEAWIVVAARRLVGPVDTGDRMSDRAGGTGTQ